MQKGCTEKNERRTFQSEFYVWSLEERKYALEHQFDSLYLALSSGVERLEVFFTPRFLGSQDHQESRSCWAVTDAKL
jgi:hypothetical protein